MIKESLKHWLYIGSQKSESGIDKKKERQFKE